MRFSAALLASVLSFSAISAANPFAAGFEDGLYARDAESDFGPSLLARGLEIERRDLHLDFMKRDLEIREALDDIYARDAEAANVHWSDPNAYKNDPATKQKWENHASSALDRAGCAGGTICGTHHSSPPGGDQRQHVTVRPDKGKTFHAYDDGTASKKGKKGKTITFRDLDLDYEY